MICCVRKLNSQRVPPRYIRCRDYSKYLKDNLINQLTSENWEPLYEMMDVNKAYKYLYKILIKTIDRNAPYISKKVKGKYSPWLSIDVKSEMNQRDKLMRKARRTKSQIYKKSRNICNNKIKNAKYKYHQELLIETARDPKTFWKILKNIFSSKNSNITPYSYSNDEQQAKADRYCSFFTSIAIRIKRSSNQLKDYVWRKPIFFPLRTTKVLKFMFQKYS